MALFSYNENDPSSSRDTVRMLVQDTDGSVKTGPREEWSFYLTDGEIDRALSLRGNCVYSAAAVCCLMLAGSDLNRNKAVRLGQFSTSNEAAKGWSEMADKFAAQSSLGTGGATAEVVWDEFSEAELRARG